MTQVGSVYGEALYDLARSEGLSQTILQELTVNPFFEQVSECGRGQNFQHGAEGEYPDQQFGFISVISAADMAQPSARRSRI